MGNAGGVPRGRGVSGNMPLAVEGARLRVSPVEGRNGGRRSLQVGEEVERVTVTYGGLFSQQFGSPPPPPGLQGVGLDAELRRHRYREAMTGESQRRRRGRRRWRARSHDRRTQCPVCSNRFEDRATPFQKQSHVDACTYFRSAGVIAGTPVDTEATARVTTDGNGVSSQLPPISVGTRRSEASVATAHTTDEGTVVMEGPSSGSSSSSGGGEMEVERNGDTSPETTAPPPLPNVVLSLPLTPLGQPSGVGVSSVQQISGASTERERTSSRTRWWLPVGLLTNPLCFVGLRNRARCRGANLESRADTTASGRSDMHEFDLPTPPIALSSNVPLPGPYSRTSEEEGTSSFSPPSIPNEAALLGGGGGRRITSTTVGSSGVEERGAANPPPPPPAPSLPSDRDSLGRVRAVPILPHNDYGHVVNGVIYFNVMTQLEQQEARARMRRIHRTIQNLVNPFQGIEVPVGGSEEFTRRRYLDFMKFPSNAYAAKKSETFDDKRKWFHERLNEFRVAWNLAWVVVDVDRHNLLQTSFDDTESLGAHDFHKEFKIQFTNEWGHDAGGLTREWFTLVTQKIFDPNVSLFMYSDVDNLTYQVNRNSTVQDAYLRYFRFIGRVIGKSIFDRQCIFCPLSRPLWKQMLEAPLEMEDLSFLDQQLYNSLQWMQTNSITDKIFETFSVEEEHFGVTDVVDLKPDGRNIPVTDENKHEYLMLRQHYAIVTRVQKQMEELCAGLWEVIPPCLLNIFNFHELELLINGMPQVDVGDWKKHTTYLGDYNDKHPVVEWFWDVVETEFSQEERARLLQFSTGTTRVPIEGFSALESNRGQNSKFAIQSTEWSECAPYPRAHTCFNRLTLPIYRTREELQRCLRMAIQMDLIVGFGLDD